MKTHGFGVVGAGLWGSVHAEIYSSHPCARLVAVCDLDPGKAEEVARIRGAARVYTDCRELARDPDVDAVAVVTPDFAHTDPILAAAAAGKHIITEKPLATTREDLDRIAQAVRRSPGAFMVDFHNRWNPPIAITRKNIEDGNLGRIMSAYFRLNDTISVPLGMLAWARQSSILWFLGSHTVDTFRYLFQDEVARVYAVSRSGVLEEQGCDVPDLYQAILEFKSGIVATMENNWIVPNTNPLVNDFKLNVTGSKGMINIDMSHNQLIERFLEDTSDHPDCLIKPLVHDQHKGFAYESIREFVDRLAAGRPMPVGLEDGVRVTQVLLAVMESARRREPVDVDE